MSSWEEEMDRLRALNKALSKIRQSLYEAFYEGCSQEEKDWDAKHGVGEYRRLKKIYTETNGESENDSPDTSEPGSAPDS